MSPLLTFSSALAELLQLQQHKGLNPTPGYSFCCSCTALASVPSPSSTGTVGQIHRLCQSPWASGKERSGSSLHSPVQNCFVTFKLLRFPWAQHPHLAWMCIPKFSVPLQYQQGWIQPRFAPLYLQVLAIKLNNRAKHSHCKGRK